MKHDNILQLYEWFEDADSYYLVLELCRGGELGLFLKKQGKLSENLTKGLMKDLLSGLAFLHSQGIMHRDLKLANLLLTKNQKSIKIADFGFSVRLSDNDEERKTVCGTPNYISPEIA